MSNSTPFWSRTGATSTTPAVIALPDGWRELKLEVDARSYAQLGALKTADAVTATNAVLTISSSGVPTAGTFTIEFDPNSDDAVECAALTFDESAADVKTALIAAGLPFLTGDITAAGGPLPLPITLTFTGVWAAIAPKLRINSDTDVGEITAAYTTSPDGNGNYAYLAANIQEIWTRDRKSKAGRFLYVATVASTGNYFVSAFR